MAMKKTATIHITCKDFDDGEIVSNDGFIMELDDKQATQAGKGDACQKQRFLMKLFEEKVKQAVTDWFNGDPDDLRSEIDEYCGGYNFEAEADEGQSELDYALEHFSARSVAHIPDTYMSKHGISAIPAPDVSVECDYVEPFFEGA